MVDPFEVARKAKGWLHDDEGPMLYQMALRAPQDVPLLEIGSYAGKSSCYIGKAAKERGTVLWAIDWHRGSVEMRRGHCCFDETVIVDGEHDTIYELRKNLKAAGLEDVVVPVVGRSDTVGKWWKIPVGFVFIDGDHDSKAAISDYRLFSPWIVDGGLLLFHDATGTGAADAAEQARRDGWHEQALVGCTAIFKR